MTNAAFFVGAPLWFEEKFQIYPPQIRDVTTKPHYFQWVKILTMSQEEIEDELHEELGPTDAFPTPLEFFLNNCYHSDLYRNLAVEAFKFFTHLDVSILYEQKKLVLGDIEDVVKKAKSIDDLIILDEQNFFAFQNLIRDSIGDAQIEPPNPNEDPRVKRIKAKARYRDKVKAKQGLGIRLNTTLASICCMGLGITPLNIGEMSYAAVGPLMRTYQEKEKYEIDVRSLQAGADSKKIKPKYWIRNLD